MSIAVPKNTVLRYALTLGSCAAALTVLPLFGCHSDAGQAMTSGEKQSADRLAKISKESGGDWSKVSPADKDYLIKNVANGDEHTAQMLITPPPGAAGGGPPGRPGGPGAPGAPKGPGAGIR